MLNLFRGGKVTSGLSALRLEDSNCKRGDAAGSGMGRIGGDAGSGGDGICDQTQECILVTQQWVRQQQAVATPQLERHHSSVVYTLGTPDPVHKVCKRVRVVPALAPRGQARSPVEVGPETRLQHMRMDPPTLPVVHPLLVIRLLIALRRGWIQWCT
nr:hypothetical protein [Tanacetum cinerariifolium]